MLLHIKIIFQFYRIQGYSKVLINAQCINKQYVQYSILCGMRALRKMVSRNTRPEDRGAVQSRSTRS